MAKEMTTERWAYFSDYANEVFPDRDEQMAGLMERAVAAGLPPIAVTPDIGRLLSILVASTKGRLAVEVGTLGGYSAMWIARGLPEDGKLITIEANDAHADFAESEFATAGLSDKIEVIRGPGLDVIPSLAGRVGMGGVDFAFIDAIKGEYTGYFDELKPLIAVGGIVAADNVFGTGQGWIDQGYGTDDFNRHVAADPDFESTIMSMRSGVLIARRVS